MIIVLAPSDAGIVAQSRARSYDFPGIYGQTYVATVDRIPQLGPTETLFFIGHGIAQGSQGVPEIGDARGDFALTGLDLWASYGIGTPAEPGIFPPLYQGRVFIDACESGDFPQDMFSLTETFWSQAQEAIDGIEVYGRAGDVSGPIPFPDDPSWVDADTMAEALS